MNTRRARTTLSPYTTLFRSPNMQTQPLSFSRSGSGLTLAWGPEWTLQSSTNVTGPFEDVQGAAGSFTPSMGNPRSEEQRLNSSHGYISYAVFCFKKKTRVHG